MKHLLTFIFLSLSTIIMAQSKVIDSGYIQVKNGMNIKFYKLKQHAKSYSFYQLDSIGNLEATQLPIWIVDNILLDDPALLNLPTSHSDPSASTSTNSSPPSSSAKEKYARFTIGFGLSVGNYLEFNNTSGTGDKNSFNLNGSLDLGHSYSRPEGIINSTNELHYTVGLQKESLTAATELQRSTDDVQTLHDIALAFTKKKKWKFNIIGKTATSIFTIFDNNYFQDVSGNGRIQSFLSPFSLVVSPGIQYQPVVPLRISLSPYSTELYGVTSDKVSVKGIFITETDPTGNFKKMITKRQALEFNIWLDYRIKEWFEMQYRLGVYSDYQLGFANNGMADGLFISRIKLIKNLYLSHRATLNCDLFNNLTKPYFTQMVQLNYTLSL